MAKPATTVALDVGTHALRAGIFEATATGLALRDIVESPLSLFDHGNGQIEQDPAQFSEALEKIFRHITPLIGIRPCQFSMACQRSSVLAWDEATGKPLSPIFSWQDTRAVERVNQLSPELNAFIQQNTGLPVNAHYGASKLAILSEEYLPRENGRVGPLAAWLTRQLTQSSHCDVVNACRTLCANIHKSPFPQWDKNLCDIWQLEANALPPIVPCTFNFGEVTFQQQLLGSLVAVTGDQNAAYLALHHQGSTAGFNNPLVVNIGSGAFILGPLNSPTLAHKDLLTAPAYATATQTQWLSEGTVNSAGTELTRWRTANTTLSESALFQTLPQWLAAEYEDIPLYLPTSAGLGSPFWVSRFKQCSAQFFDTKGVPFTPSLQQQAVAVVESIAFLIAANIEVMQGNSRPYDGIVLAGGLSRLVGLIERVSALTELTCWVSDDFEATLLGAAIACDTLNHKGCTKGHIVAAKNTAPLLKLRYQRYIALIRKLHN